MTPRVGTDSDRIRADFDVIARLSEPGASGTDRYDRFLLSLVPAGAARILDVGCGLGRLTVAPATGQREVLGVDVSPAMIERALSEARALAGRLLPGACVFDHWLWRYTIVWDKPRA